MSVKFVNAACSWACRDWEFIIRAAVGYPGSYIRRVPGTTLRQPNTNYYPGNIG